MTRRQVLQAAAAACLLVLAAFVGSAVHTDRTAPEPISFGSPGSASMVVIGAPGLVAEDIDEARTPALWALLRDGSSASLNVTTVHRATCPVDGWLTLSAGGRAAQPDAAGGAGGAGCQALPAVTGGRVEGWSSFVSAAADRPFGTTPGTLATAVAATGQCLSAVGPGAALASADSVGAVTHYQPFEGSDLTAGLVACSTSLVDVGAVTGAPGPARTESVGSVDRRVAQVVAAAPSGADILVAGLADDGEPRLRLLLAAGPRFGPGTLSSPSTRQPGLTQLDDVTATILAHTGATSPASVAGATLQRAPAANNSVVLAAQRQTALLDDDQSSRSVTPVVEPFFVSWGAVLAAGLVLLAVARWRGLGSQRRREQLGVVVRQGLVVGAAVPVATFLANIVPWWRFVWPAGALVVTTLAWAGVIGAVALRGAWRRSVTGPPTAVAIATFVVLAADVVNGSRLQLSSLLGLNPVVGGRFYGFGNVAFALFAAATFLIAIAFSTRLLAAGRPRVAAAVVAVLGVLALAVDAAPMWGSDAGGPPALLPGLAVLFLGVLGIRFTWRRALAVVGGTVGVVVLIAVADWLRPEASRSHLGRFVQTLLDGGGGDIVSRKLAQNLDTLTGTTWLAYLVPVALVLVVWLLLRPTSPLARPLVPLFDAVGTMRVGLVGLTLTGLVGLAVNDTGVAIPPITWMLAVPLVLAAALRVGELHPREGRPLTRRERWHS